MSKNHKRYLRYRQQGASMLEYALLVVFLSCAAISAVRNIGHDIEKVMVAGGGSLSTMPPDDDPPTDGRPGPGGDGTGSRGGAAAGSTGDSGDTNGGSRTR